MKIAFLRRHAPDQWLWWALMFLLFIYFTVPITLHAKQAKQMSRDLFSVSFPTEKDGWACGRWGTILHSADGGKTWVHQRSGVIEALTSISFVDPQNGWVVGDGGTILCTRDGGNSWAKQKSPVPYYLMGVQFVSRQKGWIVTERTTILYTEDGGNSWIIQFKDQDFILRCISFCDEKNGWAVGEYGYIYHTIDGGKNWHQQAGKLDFSDQTGQITGETYLFNVFAINPRTAWGVGIDGHIVRTFDGGTTWQKATKSIPKTHLFSVCSDKGDKVVIGGNSTSLWSADKGETWQTSEFRPPLTYNGIYAIAQRGGSGFVAVGSQGNIYLNNGNMPTAWDQVASY
jgi:photosystem II stability/assembly factor-like uncharacterized protein